MYRFTVIRRRLTGSVSRLSRNGVSFSIHLALHGGCRTARVLIHVVATVPAYYFSREVENPFQRVMITPDSKPAAVQVRLKQRQGPHHCNSLTIDGVLGGHAVIQRTRPISTFLFGSVGELLQNGTPSLLFSLSSSTRRRYNRPSTWKSHHLWSPI